MDIDEVIKQCIIEVAKAKEWGRLYEQLAEWLKELQEYRSIGPTPDQLRQIDHLYMEQAKKLQHYENLKQEGKLLAESSSSVSIREWDDLISKKEILNKIESEYRQWGEDYDVDQVLCDIEDFPTVAVRIFQQCKNMEETKGIGGIRNEKR